MELGEKVMRVGERKAASKALKSLHYTCPSCRPLQALSTYNSVSGPEIERPDRPVRHVFFISQPKELLSHKHFNMRALLSRLEDIRLVRIVILHHIAMERVPCFS